MHFHVLIQIHACNIYFNNSKRGGYNSSCMKGYEGRLCSICSKDIDGLKYARSGASKCVICEELHWQILKFLGILILLALYIIYLL